MHVYSGRATTSQSGMPEARTKPSISLSTDAPNTLRAIFAFYIKKHGLVYFDSTPFPGRDRGKERRSHGGLHIPQKENVDGHNGLIEEFIRSLKSLAPDCHVFSHELVFVHFAPPLRRLEAAR